MSEGSFTCQVMMLKAEVNNLRAWSPRCFADLQLTLANLEYFIWLPVIVLASVNPTWLHSLFPGMLEASVLWPVCSLCVQHPLHVCDIQLVTTAKVVKQYPLVSTAAAAACVSHRQRVFLQGMFFYALDYIITYFSCHQSYKHCKNG